MMARHCAAHVLGTVLACVWMVACSEAAPAGPRPAGSTPPESRALFAAAVEYFAGRDTLPIRVDPRPLRPEARLNSVTQPDLLTDTPEIVRMRRRVLETGGWAVADAPADWTCVFTEGYPPARPPTTEPSDSVRVRREECRRNGRYQSLIFGLPQAGTDPRYPQRWRIRAMQLFLHGFEGVNLYLEQGASGEWTVVDVHVQTGVFS